MMVWGGSNKFTPYGCVVIYLGKRLPWETDLARPVMDWRPGGSSATSRPMRETSMILCFPIGETESLWIPHSHLHHPKHHQTAKNRRRYYDITLPPVRQDAEEPGENACTRTCKVNTEKPQPRFWNWQSSSCKAILLTTKPTMWFWWSFRVLFRLWTNSRKPHIFAS